MLAKQSLRSGLAGRTKGHITLNPEPETLNSAASRASDGRAMFAPFRVPKVL